MTDESAKTQNGGAKKPRFAASKSIAKSDLKPWKLLIVDDEPEVHSVTRLALNDFRFDGRGLEFISAYSGAEAREILENDPEIAVILLDVVMETDDAGLQLAQFVRHMLGNSFVRIVLRTGHPGMAPERRVIKAFDINDYRAKTELTQDRMFSLMYTSLRTYKHITSMAQSRRHMSALVEEYRGILGRVSARLDHPVTQMLQATLVLKNELPPDSPPPIAEALTNIQRGSQDLQELVLALQQLSAVNDSEELRSEFEMNEVVGEVCEKLGGFLIQAKAQLSYTNLPRLVAYRDLFAELIEQLIRNAVRFDPAAAPHVEIYAQPHGKDWKITVADRGPGIPADNSEAIFEAFSGSRSDGGVGIGLTLCKRIVSLHGGRIWVEARPGGGSLFNFTLPATGTLSRDEH